MEMPTVPGNLVREAALRFGTPLYLYDLTRLRRDYDALRGALPPQVELYYSMKANPNPAVCRFIHGLGSPLEVASVGEYRLALDSGVPAERIVFTGPGKSRDEIRACLQSGIFCINAESLQEITVIDEEACKLGRPAPVMLRVNLRPSGVPGSRLSSGGMPGPFGIDEVQLSGAVRETIRKKFVRLIGLHTYQGTQNFRLDSFRENVCRMFELSDSIGREWGSRFSAIGLGGGFGVPYFQGDEDFPLQPFRSWMQTEIAYRAASGYTHIFMESGRFLVSRMGWYVASVLYTKTSGGKQYAVLDGGTHHRAFGSVLGRHFRSPLPVVRIPRAADAAAVTPKPAVSYTLVGKLCTPTDVLQSGAVLPELEPGDLIAFPNSGAYGLTSGSVLFLSHPLPAEATLDENGALSPADWISFARAIKN